MHSAAARDTKRNRNESPMLARSLGKIARTARLDASRELFPCVMPSKPASFVLVVGHGPQLEQEDGAAAQLRQLGAEVRTMDLWEDFGRTFDRGAEEGALARAIVFEG